MRHQFARICWMLALVLAFVQIASSNDESPNILFIAVDDLRPELGCYGATHIHSPNIDRLASSGLKFDRAYCQQAVCNPSRSSLMTGLRPDTIGVTGNHIHFRSNRPDVVTLPQYFMNNGYHAQAIGKIYHGVFPEGSSNTKWDTMGDPQSWSVPATRFGPRYYYTEKGIESARESFLRVYKPENPRPDDWKKKLVFGLATESPDVSDDTLFDGKVASAAIETLRELNQNRQQPFFLAIGFIKPHSPYIAPKKYFELYPEVDLPANTDFPGNAPKIAGHNSGELRRYSDQPANGEIAETNQRRVRQAYFACISFVDAQVGRVLDELEELGLAENTIVCLYGDHGYHLGEHGLWGKTTNFELDTRVPLIVRAPGTKATGKSTSSIVELVDLYPTLCELSGLTVGDHLEGKSFVPVLKEAGHQTRQLAFSQYPRAGKLMGYSMRTPTHRLTQWIHQDHKSVQQTELYEYSAGLVESDNIAAKSPDLVLELSRQLSEAINVDFSMPSSPSSPKQETGTSFENASAGTFQKLESEVGIWQTTAGKVLIDNQHAKTGQQCLQLAGGQRSIAELEIAQGIKTDGQLRFWAERWTKRDPFLFRIEKLSGDHWSGIYNGDQSVRVGRAFLSNITVPLHDSGITRLRFTVTSPPDTGILIDDLQIIPAIEQEILKTTVQPSNIPALVGVEAAPILKFNVRTEGTLDPHTLENIVAGLTQQTDPEDIESIRLYYTGSDGSRFSASQAIGPSVSPAKSFPLTGGQKLADGDNYFWIACKLKPTANIDHAVGVYLNDVEFDSRKTIPVAGAPSTQRIGVALRKSGDDGIHTFRIPGLVTTNEGSLIAVYDIRHDGGGDLPGNIDVGMSRSTDGGRTWQAMKIIMDMGSDAKWNHDGIGDPSILVDRTTGTIWVAATWSHGNRSWNGSGPGLEPEETGQLMLVKSEDDGVTWSEPINITKQVKKPEWSFLLQGPGKGITMSDGTLVFPAQYQDPPDPNDKTANRLPHSTFIYSRDHGDRWQIATGAFDDTTEAQIVEFADGQLMINCRYNRANNRVVMTTEDMGQSWTEHTTSRKTLIEPRSCMASLIHVGRELGHEENDWLLFSNPNSTRERNRITIKASPDLGNTWPKQHQLLLDEQNGRGYSCLTLIDRETVGILYESSQADLTFQRIPFVDVLNGGLPKNSFLQSLHFGRVFTDHMVLQADQPIRLWGSAKPETSVSVSFDHATVTGIADGVGKWMVTLPAMKPTAVPRKLIATSEHETVIVNDVLVGEVWLCAGQSNMEWPVSKSSNADQTLADADDDQLRLMNFVGAARGGSGVYDEATLGVLTPELFCSGRWRRSDADSARVFSAVGFYFGVRLRDELDCPVGIVNVSIGGTPIEAWVNDNKLQTHSELNPIWNGNWLKNPVLSQWCRERAAANLERGNVFGEGAFAVPGDEFGPNHSFKPGFMYASAIEPFVPMSIRGVLWYQGESNAQTRADVEQYDRVFPYLVSSWRDAFQNPNMPIGFVQLPAMDRPQWPVFREYQRRSLDKLDHIGMAVAIDVGSPSNVHPIAKKPVGERLAAWALADAYGKDGPSMGPLFESKTTHANKLIVSLTSVGDGLSTSDGAAPNNFEIKGAEGSFQPATAVIDGGRLILSSQRVPNPLHARYAWRPFPEPPANLVNSANLPASPFTTEEDF